MNKFSVYLSGPIAGLSPDEARSWRQYAIDYLDHKSKGRIEGLCPMRGSMYKLNGGIKMDDVLQTPHACMVRDLRDIKVSDVMFVNMIGAPETRVSKGTCIEVGMARALGVPIIAALDNGSQYDTDMLFRPCLDLVYFSLDTALDNVCHFLMP